jgi:hypothetical protein
MEEHGKQCTVVFAVNFYGTGYWECVWRGWWGGGRLLHPPPFLPHCRFRNNLCKDDSALFSRFLHGLRSIRPSAFVEEGGIANTNDNKQAKCRFLYLFWFYMYTCMCSSFQSYSFFPFLSTYLLYNVQTISPPTLHRLYIILPSPFWRWKTFLVGLFLARESVWYNPHR